MVFVWRFFRYSLSLADQVFPFEKGYNNKRVGFPTGNRAKTVPAQRLLGIAAPFAITTSRAKTNNYNTSTHLNFQRKGNSIVITIAN